jgi:hypothetical protein
MTQKLTIYSPPSDPDHPLLPLVVIVDTLTMETDLTAKIAEVNDWIDEHHAWFVEKKRQCGCADYDLKIPRLVDTDTTPHAAFYRQHTERRIMDAIVWDAAALTIHDAASAVAAHQRAMSKLHDSEDAIESAIGEASAADAVARTALEVSRYYYDVNNTLCHYQSYVDAQVVAMENFLKMGPAHVASWALKGFRKYQLTISETFESTKAGRDAYHTHGAAQSVAHTIEALSRRLREYAWREVSNAGAPTTDAGAPKADTGAPTTDAGVPTTTGAPTTDAGAPIADTGAPNAEAGAPTTDPGS